MLLFRSSLWLDSIQGVDPELDCGGEYLTVFIVLFMQESGNCVGESTFLHGIK